MGASEERIRSEVRRVAEDLAPTLGLEVVEVVFHRAGRFTLLRVDIDRPGTPGVTLEDCQRMTEALGPALDATELLESSYNLEVSSPGLDRPIRTEDDVRRNRGRRVEVQVTAPVAGSKHLTGELLGMEEGALRVLLDGGEEVLLPRENVVLARQEITVARAKERGNRVV
ncbi:MAG TPA: ribosome maturation factor RimP [Candidatus Polarisedimenticolaceae bacterium]|nr:ribosome maturation factor RimP [Candidatus Polarisedimenticolaceae bacterium]